MGGAERGQRRRKRQATATRASGASGGSPAAAPRAGGDSSGDRGRLISTVAVVVIIAVVVVAGILWQRARSAPPPLVPTQVAVSYPVSVDDGVVVAGADTAKVTVDVYEDFLCPACGAFEQRDATKIHDALSAGTVRVRYHMLNLLDDKSNPPGYSLDAAAASLCAASAGAFPGYHASLFAHQPREGGRGHSLDQLIQLGHALGAGGTFDSCVRDGANRDAVRAQLDTASADSALRRPGPGGALYFGTPTVVTGGTMVDLSNASWLDDAIRAAG